MALEGEHTCVGFGFGPIQAGLFLLEAFRSGNFRRLVVAEINPLIVGELRRADGFYAVNIAHPDHIEAEHVGPVEVLNPNDPADRSALIDAVAEADELATALPSVACYATDDLGSPHRVLAEGLGRASGPAVVYAAENRTDAAQVLRHRVEARTEPLGGQVQFLNTVIGKMSGRISRPRARGLAPLTPHSNHAFLVESFNRILIDAIRLPDFVRGITSFEERADLRPFEEAKLFGHNATHALAGYLSALTGLEQMADLPQVPGMMPFLRDAFVHESGAALVQAHRGADPLFTPDGFREYADDLLRRMTNPLLLDTVRRVVRDPERKLGWDDRLVGTMRLALSRGIEPARYAAGAAAALARTDERLLSGRASAEELAGPLWERDDPEPCERAEVLELIESGASFIRDWRDGGFADLKQTFDAVHGG